jgi:hypothetical protein
MAFLAGGIFDVWLNWSFGDGELRLSALAGGRDFYQIFVHDI